jgi:hypothetical protein
MKKKSLEKRFFEYQQMVHKANEYAKGSGETNFLDDLAADMWDDDFSKLLGDQTPIKCSCEDFVIPPASNIR